MIGPGLSPPSLLGTRRSSAHASSRDINENDLQIGTSEQVLSVSAVIRISILLVFNCGRKKACKVFRRGGFAFKKLNSDITSGFEIIAKHTTA
ncbi:uncharacterized protein LOC122543942 isoform X5 [Chiloscyllium plagiosum]|uniref:uncharacterized protein LOC122543942 isoform X5 n=1 Tax=Chiloscyllium plagiosum TaxID=36176 RepID=UPI001CB87978|nr:uncharacterized protein LOC122543942 isoform X5 [Chiloscyllium plagiosum]